MNKKSCKYVLITITSNLKDRRRGGQGWGGGERWQAGEIHTRQA